MEEQDAINIIIADGSHMKVVFLLPLLMASKVMKVGLHAIKVIPMQHVV